MLVMPYLHPFNRPAFQTVEEVVDFIGQTLEVCTAKVVVPKDVTDDMPSRVCISYTVKGLHTGITIVLGGCHRY